MYGCVASDEWYGTVIIFVPQYWEKREFPLLPKWRYKNKNDMPEEIKEHKEQDDEKSH